MKKTLLLLFISLKMATSYGQSELQIQTDGKNTFLYHTVTPKENFYSIGRLFNVSAKEIAAYNKLDMAKGLSIGQTIKVPLTPKNFNQKSTAGRPVYYEVGQKEGLYRVSTRNHNVLMANLRKWNGLKSDNLNPGQHLIVGYLISPEAANIIASNPVERKQEETPNSTVTTAATTPPPARKETEVAKTDKIEEEPKQTAPKKSETATVKTVSNPASINDGNGGFFKPQFEQQVKTQAIKSDITATAGIFKTTSGWQDAKYYALLDHVEPGTIIRIINPTNNKTVYAKVLGEMSSIRQNQGYDIRISNAAATALDITEQDKFIVKVNY